MAKIPFTHGKSFKELGVIGKVTVVFSIVGTIVGSIFTIWSTSVFAAERVELYVSNIVHEKAPKIVKAEMNEFQDQQRFYYLSNQVQFLSLEKRAIEAEMNSITRDKLPTELSAEDVTRLETLRNDRRRILDRIARYQNEMQEYKQR